jgi:hypothetical protein
MASADLPVSLSHGHFVEKSSERTQGSALKEQQVLIARSVVKGGTLVSCLA